MSETIRFPISGMTCASCVNRITRALKKVEGVTRVKVDLGRETATVTRDAGVPDSVLALAVAGAGYAADLALAVAVDEPAPRGFLARLFSTNP